MAQKHFIQKSLSDQFIPDHKLNKGILHQIDQNIDWRPISSFLNKKYFRGKSELGRQAYQPLLLFKMTLLQTWYNLSDQEVENQLNDRFSFLQFCGLGLDDQAPDTSSIARFRNFLVKAKILEKLLKKLNKQLEKKQLLVRAGTIVDASLTPSPRKPKSERIKNEDEEEVANDTKTETEKKETAATSNSDAPAKLPDTKTDEEKPKWKETAPGDAEGKWVKKGKKSTFGYKRHHAVDAFSGLILGVSTTSANVHDTQLFDELIEKSSPPRGSSVYADKGYFSRKNDDFLKEKGLGNCIQRKALVNRPLSKEEKSDNSSINKTIRYKVEQVFGSIKKWFGGHTCRYVGLARTHGQHVLEAICYNLYRLPGLLAFRPA